MSLAYTTCRFPCGAHKPSFYLPSIESPSDATHGAPRTALHTPPWTVNYNMVHEQHSIHRFPETNGSARPEAGPAKDPRLLRYIRLSVAKKKHPNSATHRPSRDCSPVRWNATVQEKENILCIIPGMLGRAQHEVLATTYRYLKILR